MPFVSKQISANDAIDDDVMNDPTNPMIVQLIITRLIGRLTLI
jgi:hypothetical protein